MKTKWDTQKLIYTAMLAAAAGALMSLEFPVPLMPPFYKVDRGQPTNVSMSLSHA